MAKYLTERFEMRLRPRDLELLDRAARADERTASELVRDAALRRARRVLREAEGSA